MEHKPFPPSPRRLALARRAGLHAASPVVVGALACAAGLAASIATARAGAVRLGAWIAAACDHAGDAHATGHAGDGPAAGHAGALLGAGDLAIAVVELVAPILAAAAVLALAAHVAQTRSVWLPRRRVEGAPGMPPRTLSRALLELGGPALIGAVCVGWLWLLAPRLAALVHAEAPLAGAGALLASFVAALACAWACAGAADALSRHLAVREALAMSPAEKREDDRLASADPRWRARRSSASDAPSLAGAVVVILGDGVAAAIAWDPTRQPIPTRTARGRGARATQIVALARRDRIAVHRDPELATALAASDGPVPEARWPRLAEVVAAVRGR